MTKNYVTLNLKFKPYLAFYGKMSEILHITNTSQSVCYHTLGKANTPTCIIQSQLVYLLTLLHVKESQIEGKWLTFLERTMFLRAFVHLVSSSTYNSIGIFISA